MKYVYGKEHYLIDKTVQKIIDKWDGNVFKYGDETSVDLIIEEILTISLFDKKKLIIITDHPSMKKADYFLKSLEVLNEKVEVVFVGKDLTIKKNDELVKFVEQHGEVIKIDVVDENEMEKIIETMVKNRGATISKAGIKIIIYNLPKDLRIIASELDKLTSENKNLTIEQINISISKYQDNDYFALTNSIISNNTKEIIISYNNKKRTGETSVSIINQISSILSLAKKINAFKKLGFTEKDVATELNIHPYRIRKVSEIIMTSSQDKIDDLLIKLSDLDKAIKTSQLDPTIGLDHFMMYFIK